jgi:SAM-dependent methyltransferase
MGVAAHLGIRLDEYDAKIRTFIPWYDELLDAAAQTFDGLVGTRPTRVVDLGIGSGALAARCALLRRTARIVGIDADEGMLAFARQRLPHRLTTIAGDFLSIDLPRCDAFVASLALHHVRTRRAKAAFYRRCLAALKRGGVLISADCVLASSRRQRQRDRQVWREHLQRTYRAAEAEALLRAWAREDVYFELDDEVSLLRSAGFDVDVPWRRHGFAVLAGTRKPSLGARYDG